MLLQEEGFNCRGALDSGELRLGCQWEMAKKKALFSFPDRDRMVFAKRAAKGKETHDKTPLGEKKIGRKRRRGKERGTPFYHSEGRSKRKVIKDEIR